MMAYANIQKANTRSESCLGFFYVDTVKWRANYENRAISFNHLEVGRPTVLVLNMCRLSISSFIDTPL
jgi:hypothetical protein